MVYRTNAHSNAASLLLCKLQRLIRIKTNEYFIFDVLYPSGAISLFPVAFHAALSKTKRTLLSHDFTFETHVQSPLGAVLRYSFTTERVLSLTRDRQTLTSRYFRVTTTPYTTANRNGRWTVVGRMKSPTNSRPRGPRFHEKYATKLFLYLF